MVFISISNVNCCSFGRNERENCSATMVVAYKSSINFMRLKSLNVLFSELYNYGNLFINIQY